MYSLMICCSFGCKGMYTRFLLLLMVYWTVAAATISGESFDKDCFKLELASFNPGSAIPGVRFVPERQQLVVGQISQQRKRVTEKIDKLLEINSKNDYRGATSLFSDNSANNRVIESFYNFMHSFGTAPVAFGVYKEGSGFAATYKAKRFSKKTKDKLLQPVEVPEMKFIDSYHTVADIDVRITDTGEVKRKTTTTFMTPGLKAAYSPSEIKVNGRTYHLSGLVAIFEPEEDYWLLRCEQLDIIGSGRTEEEARESLAQELDYIYQKLRKARNTKLTSRLLRIKKMLPLIVTEVE